MMSKMAWSPYAGLDVTAAKTMNLTRQNYSVGKTTFLTSGHVLDEELGIARQSKVTVIPGVPTVCGVYRSRLVLDGKPLNFAKDKGLEVNSLPTLGDHHWLAEGHDVHPNVGERPTVVIVSPAIASTIVRMKSSTHPDMWANIAILFPVLETQTSVLSKTATVKMFALVTTTENGEPIVTRSIHKDDLRVYTGEPFTLNRTD